MRDDAWKENISFVLVCPREAGNIGASARALKNFGFPRLELVAPKKFPAEEAVWFAHGALDVLEKIKIHEGLKDALAGKTLVAGASRRTGKQRGSFRTLKEGVKRLKSHALAGRSVSVLFGSEDRGLSNGQTEECAFLMNIPADPGMPSFNLSQAVLLVAYELFLADGCEGPGAPKKLATHDELSFFYERLREALDSLHYIPRGNRDMEITILKNMKQILARSEITRWELKMLHGIISQARARLE
ncbi:MAG: hypothetical protein M0Z75_17785 [Nitrospiraceae bacterium]|nr:hypothetical protein [Nitrospiraceae bacterium]